MQLQEGKERGTTDLHTKDWFVRDLVSTGAVTKRRLDCPARSVVAVLDAMGGRSNSTSWLLDVGGYLGDCALTALLRDSVTTGAVTFDVHGLEANARTIRAYHARDNYLLPARGSAASVSVHPTARGGRCVQADFGGGGGRGSRGGITLPDACSSTRVRMSTPASGTAAEATDIMRALATRTAENGSSPPPRHYLSTARILPHAPRRVFGFVESFVSDKQELYGHQPATITLDSVRFPAPASTTKEGIGLRVKVTGAAAAKVLRGAVQLLQTAPPFLILQDLLDDKDAREVLSLLAENVSLEKYWILSADLLFLNAEKVIVQKNLGDTSSDFDTTTSTRRDRGALLEKKALPERLSSSSGSCESFDCLSEDASAPTACWLRGLTLIRQQAKRGADYKNPVAWATLFPYGTHDEPVRRFGAVSSYAVVPARAGCKTLQIAAPRAEKMGYSQVNFTVATGLD